MPESLTPAQVETAIANYRYTYTSSYTNTTAEYSYTNSDGSVDWNELHYEGKELDTEIGKITFVQAEGGEGEGDHAHLVLHTEATGQYFRIDGWYQSYDGLYLDGDLREVQLVQRLVNFYE